MQEVAALRDSSYVADAVYLSRWSDVRCTTGVKRSSMYVR
jgi:hypothetical protein